MATIKNCEKMGDVMRQGLLLIGTMSNSYGTFVVLKDAMDATSYMNVGKAGFIVACVFSILSMSLVLLQPWNVSNITLTESKERSVVWVCAIVFAVCQAILLSATHDCSISEQISLDQHGCNIAIKTAFITFVVGAVLGSFSWMCLIWGQMTGRRKSGGLNDAADENGAQNGSQDNSHPTNARSDHLETIREDRDNIDYSKKKQ